MTTLESNKQEFDSFDDNYDTINGNLPKFW